MCIYKTSLPHLPDKYIGFTSSCPPTFYNKIAPMVLQMLSRRRIFGADVDNVIYRFW